MRVTVGGGTVTEVDVELAEQWGRPVGERDHALVRDGLGGGMEAVCRGVKDASATTIGVLLGEDRTAANPSVDVPVATGLGQARNGLVVLNGDVRKSQRDLRVGQKPSISEDAAIAIDGGSGTLSEIGFAGAFDRPKAGLGTHDAPGAEAVETPRKAVTSVESTVRGDGKSGSVKGGPPHV